jgi:hypothetical protein
MMFGKIVRKMQNRCQKMRRVCINGENSPGSLKHTRALLGFFPLALNGLDDVFSASPALVGR